MKRVAVVMILLAFSCKQPEKPQTDDLPEDTSAKPLPLFPESLDYIPAVMDKLNLNEVTGVLEKKGAVSFWGSGGPQLEFIRNKKTGKISSDYRHPRDNTSFYWSWRGNELLKITGGKDTVKYTVADGKVTSMTRGYTIYYTYGRDGNLLTGSENSSSFKHTSSYFWSEGKLQRIESTQEGVPYLSVKYFDERQFPYLQVDYKDATMKDTLYTIRYSYR